MSGIATPAPTWKYSQGRLIEGSLLMASMHASVVGIAASATHVRPCAAQAAVQLCCTSASTHWLSNMLASRHGPITVPDDAEGAGVPPAVSSGGGEGGKGGGMHSSSEITQMRTRTTWLGLVASPFHQMFTRPCESVYVGDPAPASTCIMHPEGMVALFDTYKPNGSRIAGKPPTPSPLLVESSSFCAWAAHSSLVSARAPAPMSAHLTSYDGARSITGHSGGGGGDVGGEGSGGGGEGGGEGEGGGGEGCTHAQKRLRSLGTVFAQAHGKPEGL